MLAFSVIVSIMPQFAFHSTSSDQDPSTIVDSVPIDMSSADNDAEFYVLRSEAKHDQDVKHVAAIRWGGLSGLVTSSRDQSVRTWTFNESTDLVPQRTFVGHQGFVNAAIQLVGVGLTAPTAPGDLIASVSNDGHCLLWAPEDASVVGVLDGHTKPVKCICVTSLGDVVTGSWDHTLCVWQSRDGSFTRTLQYRGHSNSVTAVVASLDGGVVSGSGDKTIHYWHSVTGDTLRILIGHQDTVQALAMIPGAVSSGSPTVLSAGNDCMIFHWNLETGSPLRSLRGHDAFIYSLAVNPAAGQLEFASAGEDRKVKLWKDFAVVQEIPHPRLVWSVAYAQTDTEGVLLVSASEDGSIRCWTKDLGMMAPQDRIDALEEACKLADAVAAEKAAAAAKEQPSIDPKLVVRSLQVLNGMVGERDGVNKLVYTDAGDIDAYQWVASTRSWSRVGTVVSKEDRATEGSVGSKRPRPRQRFQGKDVDYLFDVELNGAQLKLAYSRGQSIFDAAQNFINDNANYGVSQEDRELIVKHIMDNIDPDDLRLVGGMASSSPSATTGAAAPAFSAFAQESAELRARGGVEAQSWQERMKALQSAGEDVAFSTYAQEGKALESGAGLPQATQQHSVTDFVLPLSANATYLTIPKMDVVKQKLVEGGADASFIGQFVDPVFAAATANQSPLPLLAPWSAAFTTAQVGSTVRPVLLDILRLYSTLQVSDSDWTEAILAGDSLTTDNEKIIFLRVLCNLLSKALDETDAAAKLRMLLLANPALRGGSIIAVIRNQHKPNSVNSKSLLKEALLAFLRNAALVLRYRSASAVQEMGPSVHALFGLIADLLVFESGVQERSDLLRCAATLVVSPDVLSPLVGSESVLAAGRQHLVQAAKSLKTFGGRADVVQMSGLLHQAFSVNN
jgi:phospholipase A-2-activating protein